MPTVLQLVLLIYFMQGISSYEYETHTISSKDKTYALRSSTKNLDNYVNQTVTIKGNEIKGYPVDGRPEYIDVKEGK